MDDAAIAKLVQDSIAAAIKPLAEANNALAANQKILGDTLASDATAKEAAKDNAATAEASRQAAKDGVKSGEPAPKPLTAEDVSRLVSDSVAGAMKARDTAATSTAQREAFVAEKLKGLPAVYQARLGTDPAKWGTEEQAIRELFKTDLAAAGATVKDIGGNAGGATASTATAETKGGDMGLSPGQAAFARNLKLPA